MHPNRRRKKRPNYGIRTVEVMRGPNGFGFTISGQQPCILSCIVSNSPADQAGLRAGDFLISVNGVSVSKITHDAVVNLIGNSIGPIKMTIAENYYSDSSDEDIDLGRAVNSRKPKYMHKPRMHRNYKHENRNFLSDRLLLDSSNKKVMKLRECAINHNPHDSRSNSNIYNDEATGISVNHNLNISNSMPMEEEGGPIEFKAIVGYLGTIEMPKQLLPNSRLQTVCSCIRKLRQEKRSPTTVLMTVLPTCLTLKNASNHILAIYPTNRVVYISSSTDKESRYFGLVTSAVCDTRSIENVHKRCENSYVNIWETGERKSSNLDEKPDVAISNSCHVFMTDPKIVEHSLHAKKAENFKISCTTDVVTGNCLEFPKNALYIVSIVQNMYRLQSSELDASKNGHKHDEIVANSPQPSASSNSDSGIGFRDDCGNISDRILVVEFPSHRPIPNLSNNHKRPTNIVASNMVLDDLDLTLNNDQVQSFALNNARCENNFDFKLANVNMNTKSVSDDNKHLANLNNIRAFENVCIKNVIEKQELDYLVKQHKDVDYTYIPQEELTSRLTVRAMPNPKNLKVGELSPHSVSSEEHSRNGDVDTGQVFSERPIDVPDNSPSKKSYETVSLHSVGDDIDFKSSVDNVSMHSTKSIELSNLKSIFKAPSTKIYENKKSTKRQLKMMSSCDNLLLEKYEASILNYKLSPKVYGISKPNHSCEQLNNFESERFGFGSLQDLYSWTAQTEKPTIAQSEPDIRLERKGQSSTNDLRSNKPIMEKRRRARINNCLNELKTLILDAMKKDPARHSKLEKADILEMTVKHLQNMQRQQTAMSAASDPAIVNKFRAGFSECANEVSRFPGLDSLVKRRLLQHLANCLNQGKQETAQQQVQLHILPTPATSEVTQNGQPNGIILGNGGVQLVPTRLPNGDIALVLPTSASPPSTSNNPLPLLVPIPTRTASTASASSSSNYSTSESPEPLDTYRYSPPMQKPLSLVMRKAKVQEEERMWRPW